MPRRVFATGRQADSGGGLRTCALTRQASSSLLPWRAELISAGALRRVNKDILIRAGDGQHSARETVRSSEEPKTVFEGLHTTTAASVSLTSIADDLPLIDSDISRFDSLQPKRKADDNPAAIRSPSNKKPREAVAHDGGTCGVALSCRLPLSSRTPADADCTNGGED